MKNETQVALISGASRGIGAATALETARRGYHVVVNYRSNAEAADRVVNDIVTEGGSAESIQADVCDARQVAAMVQRVFSEHQRIDALICNANTVDPPFEPLLALSWDSFIGKVSGELAGAFHLTQHVLPLMELEGAGRVVFISSTTADGVGSVAAHSTAKSALNTFSQHVAAVAAQSGVAVNTVAFSTVLTESTAFLAQNERFRDYVETRSVLKRLMNVDDAARAVAALATDPGFSAAVGQIIRVDGGFDLLDQQMHPTTTFF